MPGIWPGAKLHAYRQGDQVTIATAWSDSGTTVDGRSTTDAALSICEETIGDLNFNMSLSVVVLAGNGWEHLAFKDYNQKCHSG